MKTTKFTICYRHIHSGEIFYDHGEGRVWSEVANQVIEARIIRERLEAGSTKLDMSYDTDRAVMNYRRSRYEVMFVFKGHQKQLI